jgi:TonB family protein
MMAQNSGLKLKPPASQRNIWKFPNAEKKPTPNKLINDSQGINPTPKEHLGTYNIVVETYNTLYYAQSLCQRLRKEGYPAQIYLEEPKQYHVLAISSYSEEFAQLTLNRIMQSFPNPWILRIESDSVAADSTYVDDEEYSLMNESVEVMPSFPGGLSALFKYLSMNVVYPIAAEENGIQGRVLVAFIVEKDGSIIEARVVKSVDPSLDKEALRVIKSMPRWIPGKQDGVPVRVRYNVPVNFRLS